MSKISEQKALEAYPQKYDNLLDANVDRRIGYHQGYDQGMQDFLKKAEEFLYLQLLNNGSIECGNIERLIDNFKKYIKKEN